MPTGRRDGVLIIPSEASMSSYADRLHWTSRSCAFKKLQRSVAIVGKEFPRLSPWCGWLLCIGLVESTERPPSVRLIERCCQLAFGRWRIFTCGPLQMRESPYRLRSSVAQGLLLLERSTSPTDITAAAAVEIARLWHGASKRQLGSEIGYANALVIAADVLGYAVESADQQCVLLGTSAPRIFY